MIYQRADGKVVVNAAGQLYTRDCPPPQSCCADDSGWNGNPPWGPNTPPPWFDPNRPPDFFLASQCPAEACARQDGLIVACEDLVAGRPSCTACCCPTSDCRMEVDQTNGFLVPTSECIVDFDLSYRIRYYSRTTSGLGSFGIEIAIDNDARYHQNPLASQPNEPCCALSGTLTRVVRSFDTRSGYDQTDTFTDPPDRFAFWCPVGYRSVAGPPPFGCNGSQPPPPDPGGCGGFCDVDTLTAYRDCRRATFRRYQKTSFVDQYGPGFTESEQVYFAVCKPTNGNTTCPLTIRLNTPDCLNVVGGGPGAGQGGNLP